MARRSFFASLLLLPTLAFAQHDHGGAPQAAQAPGASGQVLEVPPKDVGVETFAARAEAQRATANQFRVPIDFRFTDRREASGITFSHQIVDDAGKTYKAAHYDHGNGVAAADVDGDGLVDLFFTSQVGGNELWKNLGGGKFGNVTAAAGVALPDRVAVSASFADTDNDGDQDLYVTTVRMGNALFENDGKGRFKDVSKAAGVDYVGHSSGAVFLDYDKDGLLDLFVVNVGKYTTEAKGRGGFYVAFEDAFAGHKHPERTERSVLYRNLGKNRFEDVTDKMGLVDGGWSGDATLTDWNQDGYPDLYVLNMQGDDHYWENQGGKRFVDRTAELFPKTPWGAMGVKSFDYDNDGDLDLYLTDMHSDMFKDIEPQDEKRKLLLSGAEKFFDQPENNVFGNAFFRNRGNGTFEEVSDALWLENYWPWGVSVGDLNADGWQDILIAASMNYPFRYGLNSLMINNRGERFLDAEILLGIEPRAGEATRKPWFGLDCDGEDKAHRFCQGRTGRVTVTGTLGTRSSVIFDLDGDGDLDIVTQEFNSPPQVFVSDLAQKRKPHFVQVRLNGQVSNRNGLGATVRVTAGGKTYTQMMDGASGYLSHSVLPLYFGLGDAARVDGVEVLWPSGRKQTVAGPLEIGSTVDVAEPK
ncbi:MAG TPA: CRTAC1 family protein [Thermoanaerobaculia bacterium]|nr:CRTAC1 family protein [Thermoanaerobaculia bacterium]